LVFQLKFEDLKISDTFFSAGESFRKQMMPIEV